MIVSKIHLINDYIAFFNIDLGVYGAFQSCTCGSELKMHIVLKYEQIVVTFFIKGEFKTVFYKRGKIQCY